MWDWDDDHVAAMDFETSGTKPEYALQPWRVPKGDAWATSLAWVWPQAGKLRVGGGLAPSPVMMAEFLEWAAREERAVCGWNLAFDLSVLLAYDMDERLIRSIRWLDGMLLWRHVEIEPEYDETGPKRSYGLKPWVREFEPEHAGYEEEIDFHDASPAARAKLHAYNVKDNVFTLRACKRLWKALTPRQRSAALLEADCLPMVASANLRGLLVDKFASHDVALKLEAQALRELEALAPDILPTLPAQTKGRPLSDREQVEKVIRSPKQLASLMFDADKWGLTPLKKSEAGNWSTDKETLHELSFVDPRAKQLRSYREALNQKKKFAEGLIEAVDYCADNGRAHPMAKVFGTYSGRFTYSSKQEAKIIRVREFKTKPAREETVNAELPIGFALHQMKRGPEFRCQIVAPPGCTIVEFDAAGQEFRWMAIASGDTTMLQLCLPGEDAHSFMGVRVDHEFEYRQLIRLIHELDTWPADAITALHKQAKQARYAGKVGNLSLQYRTSAKRFMITARVDYGLPIELPEATRIHGIYPRTYTGVPRYWKSQIALTKQLGYVETLAGRRVQVRGDWSGSFGWSMGSTAINYRIQGTGGDQKYLAMSVLNDYCTDIGAAFMIDLHDGLYFAVRDDKVQEFCAEGKRLLDSLPYEKAWGFKPPIPLPFDCKAGKTWGSLKGVEL